MAIRCFLRVVGHSQKLRMKLIASFLALLTAIVLATPSGAADSPKASTATPEESIRSFYSWYVTALVGTHPEK